MITFVPDKTKRTGNKRTHKNPMLNIYFEKRVLQMALPSEQPSRDPGTVIYHCPDPAALDAVPGIFTASPCLERLVVPVPDGKLEEHFNRICGAFGQLDAGGGLVTNDKGEYLLIFRNGCWDLPKGKREPGEPVHTTALREVEEECGITGLELLGKLCITRHCYRLRGTLMLKHTHWYRMHCPHPRPLKPQQEENILQAVWVAREDLPRYLQDTYPSIREVFETAGLI